MKPLKMVKTRIRKHKRQTKKGRVTVKPHIRKIKGGKISKDTRQIFNIMSTRLPNEYGGYLDFDKSGRLERFLVVPGHSDYVELDDDYEAMYHTHPEEEYADPPSAEDLVTLLQSKKQQIEIIFNGKTTYLIVPSKKAKALLKYPTHVLIERFEALWINAMKQSKNRSEAEKRYIKLLRQQGFIIVKNLNPNKPLKIPMQIKEPKK